MYGVMVYPIVLFINIPLPNKKSIEKCTKDFITIVTISRGYSMEYPILLLRYIHFLGQYIICGASNFVVGIYTCT